MIIFSPLHLRSGWLIFEYDITFLLILFLPMLYDEAGIFHSFTCGEFIYIEHAFAFLFFALRPGALASNNWSWDFEGDAFKRKKELGE